MFLKKAVGVASVVRQIGAAGEPRRLGEEPQDAAVEDAALFGGLVQLQVEIHIAVKAAVLIIPQPFPEGQDGIAEHGLGGLLDAGHKIKASFSDTGVFPAF